MKKLLVTLTMFAVILPVFALTLSASAQSPANDMLWGGYEGNVQAATGLGNTDPRAMAGKVVNIMLGFIGIIAVIIILLGGFKWMTAAGNEENIDAAKKMIGAGLIGLFVILAAFSLAQFILNAMYGATGATG